MDLVVYAGGMTAARGFNFVALYGDNTVVGNQMGKGSGKTAMTVLGAIGGVALMVALSTETGRSIIETLPFIGTTEWASSGEKPAWTSAAGACGCGSTQDEQMRRTSRWAAMSITSLVCGGTVFGKSWDGSV